MLKRLCLAIVVLAGLGGAAVAFAGLTAPAAMACDYHSS